MRKRKAHGMVVDFIDAGNQLAKLQALKVGVVTVRDVVIGMIRILLPHEREDHVVGVEVSRRGKVFIALELHSFAQMEGVGFTIFADVPAFGEARL